MLAVVQIKSNCLGYLNPYASPADRGRHHAGWGGCERAAVDRHRGVDAMFPDSRPHCHLPSTPLPCQGTIRNV